MKNERALRNLVTPIFSAPTVADGLVTTLRRVVELTGATAGVIAIRPRCQEPIVVTAGAKRSPAALREWLTTVAATPAARPQLTRVVPPGAPGYGNSAGESQFSHIRFPSFCAGRLVTAWRTAFSGAVHGWVTINDSVN